MIWQSCFHCIHLESFKMLFILNNKGKNILLGKLKVISAHNYTQNSFLKNYMFWWTFFFFT